MPQTISLLTLRLVFTWYEESTPGEVKIVLAPKIVKGPWCSYNEQSQIQHVLIMQDFGGVGFGWCLGLGSKHGQVNGKLLHYTKTIIYFGPMPKSSSKMLFKLNYVFMAPFIVVLGTQISNIKMRSSSLKNYH